MKPITSYFVKKTARTTQLVYECDCKKINTVYGGVQKRCERQALRKCQEHIRNLHAKLPIADDVFIDAVKTKNKTFFTWCKKNNIKLNAFVFEAALLEHDNYIFYDYLYKLVGNMCLGSNILEELLKRGRFKNYEHVLKGGMFKISQDNIKKCISALKKNKKKLPKKKLAELKDFCTNNNI